MEKLDYRLLPLDRQVASRRKEALIVIHKSGSKGIAVAIGIALGGVCIFGYVEAAPATDSIPQGVLPSTGDFGIVALTSKQQASDAIDGGTKLEELGSGGLKPESTRKLGNLGGTIFWGAVDNAGNVCVVARLDGSLGITGSTCGSAAILKAKGLALGVSSATQSVEAYLLPDGIAAGDTKGYNALSPNLIAVDLGSTSVPTGTQLSTIPGLTDTRSGKAFEPPTLLRDR